MSKPTLLRKGALRPPDDNPELAAELDKWVPIEYIIDWFRQRIGRVGIANRVLILKSETASGKSTLLPPQLLRVLVRAAAASNPRAPGIICTQPKILTAIENVMEMMKYNDDKYLKLGTNMGWNTKNNKVPITSPGFISATIGVLAQQLKVMTDDEIMQKYQYILIDETHERDLQTDMAIYRLKGLLSRCAQRVECPFVVLMSATFEPEPFLDYFGVSLGNFIWCTGATAAIEEMWDWNQGRIVNDYPRAAASIVKQICVDNPDDDTLSADILIFLPGSAEFKLTMSWLTKVNSELVDLGPTHTFTPLQIDGAAVKLRNADYNNTINIPTAEQTVVIHGKKYTPKRRVILTTNVAETGLTLPNLRYVIDAGYNREVEYNPVYGVNALITKPAPQSRIRQRRGRAGRKLPGVFYPLYPKHIYDMLPKNQFPIILSGDISSIMLDIVHEQIKIKELSSHTPEFTTMDIDMITVPAPDALYGGLEKLYTIGFISAESCTYGPKITKLGNIATLFDGISPESTRMILSAYFWGASVLDVITIAAWLTIDARSFIAPVEKSKHDTKHSLRAGTTFDHTDHNDSYVTVDKTASKRARTPPEINWLLVYRAGLPGFMSAEGMMFRMRLLLADDFIDGLILFYGIKYAINADETKESMAKLEKWCRDCGISYAACMEFIRVRDDIIEHMIQVGLDPFVGIGSGLLHTTEHTIFDIFTRIKYCIYDGYKCNLVTRKGDHFHTQSGLEVAGVELFTPAQKAVAESQGYGFVANIAPYNVIYSGLAMKLNKETGVYDISTERISTMDGFVSID